MTKTREDLCVRTLRMLNMCDGDNPPSAGDTQIVNGLIDPTMARLSRAGLIYIIDFGVSTDLTTGAIPDSLFVPLAQVLSFAAANDFGASAETFKAVADLGEQTLTALRYKKDRASNPVIQSEGTRGDLCYRVLNLLGVIRQGDYPSDEAVAIVDAQIFPTLDNLSRRGLLFVSNPGTGGQPATGQFDGSVIVPLSQILAKPSASEFGVPFIGGTLDDYAKLAADGEQTLLSMRYKARRDALPTIPTEGTRGDLCYRTLNLLGVIHQGDMPSDDAVAIVDAQISPTLENLSRRGILFVSLPGNGGQPATGAFDFSIIVPLAQVLTKAAASSFGAPYIGGTLDDYSKLAADGEQTLISMRYKANRDAIAIPPVQGTRGDLCQRTLKILGIIQQGDIATDEAVQVVDRLIDPTAESLQRRGVVYQANLGTAGDQTSGNVPASEIIPFAQVLAESAFHEFPAALLKGKFDDFAALAQKGEGQLRAMQVETDLGIPIRGQYY